MSKKEIKVYMSFIDENGKLVEIPENIQKHIEAREEFWFDKIKDIDIKCGIVLERLELMRKALELACLSLRSKCDYCKYKNNPCPPEHSCSNLVMEYFMEQAKEMMKSE